MLDFRKTLSGKGNVIATDNWSVAPALFLADKQYVVPKITDSSYIETVLDLCKKVSDTVLREKGVKLEMEIRVTK